ncbi:hypothetical protein HaLaN_12811 [Haematococcus lacustris]|uniref:Uncharacterized protein n=1 Tax=Haematococcus lacustris TaxID=44745 RepID=A0A699ZAW9_HAELA|nr:hypothetical protein HaLaN_12811 [Haematococcus lacustris]
MRLAAFLQLAGFNSSQGPLPLSYPIVEAFRLVIQAVGKTHPVEL